MKMNKKIVILGLVIIAIVVICAFVSSGLLFPKLESNYVNNISGEQEEYSDIVILNIFVIDSLSQEPIENATVYLGASGGSGMSYTDSQGNAILQGFVYGSYCLNVFKKGYQRFFQSYDFAIGEQNLTIELTKKLNSTVSFTLEGIVIEVVTAEGTLSENHYLKIKINGTDKEEYIFNEIGINSGFANYVNKKVEITGFFETGFIGWQFEKTNGIYIESIKET
jgi:hypothetical protein